MSATTMSSFCSAPTTRSAPTNILATWFRRARDRARDLDALSRMSDRDLMDIRINRFEVKRALSKPFWKS